MAVPEMCNVVPHFNASPCRCGYRVLPICSSSRGAASAPVTARVGLHSRCSRDAVPAVRRAGARRVCEPRGGPAVRQARGGRRLRRPEPGARGRARHPPDYHQLQAPGADRLRGEDLDAKFKASNWGRKLAKQAAKRVATDFDRYKATKARQAKVKLVNEKLAA